MNLVLCIKPAPLGIPQGSKLGRLLFLIFVNSLTNVIKERKCLLFADDVKIYLDVNNMDNSLQIQWDLDSVFVWTLKNKLYFNINVIL